MAEIEQPNTSIEQQLETLLLECERLRNENARLTALLEANGITPYALPPKVIPITPVIPVTPVSVGDGEMSTAEKLALFRDLFRGRADVYPVRWESANGRSGYTPACGNEWRPGICEKPRMKCADCGQRDLLPITDKVIYGHLTGRHTIGVYPLMPDDTCYFLAVDFDDAEWKEDALSFVQSCRELEVPASLEISRSGSGAHVWIFFAGAVSASEARRLGTALISYTCLKTRQLKLGSYDRLFPNQDFMPRGGFGNLIALPLQKKRRAENCSVFVDDNFVPWPDQWTWLASVRRMQPEEIATATIKASGGTHPLDIAFIAEEDEKTPWKPALFSPNKVPQPLPGRVRITLANRIFFDKEDLTQTLTNRLIRLAAFQNPEFYKAQAMRLSVWDKPRVIGCAENFPRHIALPRGCLDEALALLAENGVATEISDERTAGQPVAATFNGKLRPDQETAVQAMLSHDIGVLCAPTAFGKTVAASALIAKRGINTLILVHRTQLLTQWKERLAVFLTVEGGVGVVGGGKHKPTGAIDIAVMQSLSRKGEVDALVRNYGQIVVDECHHLSAFSFENLLREAGARHVLGLTATPFRRDGHHPIIFMQCGPVRHTAAIPPDTPIVLEVHPRILNVDTKLPEGGGIQDLFRTLAESHERNRQIINDVLAAATEGRHVIVLTERTEHVERLRSLLNGHVEHLFALHGRMKKKQRAEVLTALEALPDDAPRVLLATGRLVGEGFDHPLLDTLVMAMPISWRGTLQQYVGRLHRAHALKTSARVYDYVDAGHPQLVRMWDKRQRGYRAIGYKILG